MLTYSLGLWLIIPPIASFALVIGANSGMTYASPISSTSLQGDLCNGTNGNLSASSTPCTGSTATTSLNNILTTIVDIMSVVVGIVAVIMLIVGGLRYVASGGNDQSVAGAKNTILYAIVGLVVVAMAQVVVHFVLGKLNSATGS